MLKAHSLAFQALVALVLCSTELRGQEFSNFTQFYFNPASLNPSFTGIDGQAAVFLSYRKQWVGIEGSPSVSNFSFQAPNPKRLAIGLNFNQDKRGVIATSSFLVSSSYTIPLKKEIYMRFGFSMGSGFFRTDIDALRFGSPTTDPVTAGLLQRDVQILGNSGISIHSKVFHLGIALPHLFRTTYLPSNSIGIGTFKPLDQFIIHGSYRYYIQNGKFLLEPYLNYRLNRSNPSQIEVASVLHIRNVIWLGASYKQDFGFSGMTGYKFSPTMAIGYSYTIKNTGLNELASPSHEIQLGLLFGARYRNIPVYSFVNSEKQKSRGRPTLQTTQKKKSSPLEVQERAAKAVISIPNEKSVKEPAEVTNKPSPSGPTQPSKEPVIRKETGIAAKARVGEPDPSLLRGKQNQDTTVSEERDRPTNFKEGIPRLREKISGLDDLEEGEDASELHGTSHLADSLQEVDERERLERLDEHKENPTEVNLVVAPHDDRYERVQRGNHQAEMNLGDYVIIGVFKSEANAKKWTDGLKALGFLDVDYGYLTGKSTWYVHFQGTDDIDKAKEMKTKYRKMKLFRDAWLLTVHP